MNDRAEPMGREETAPDASPCVGVCALSPAGTYCLGCRRTMDEIQRWTAMSDAERRVVRDRLRLQSRRS